MRRFLHDDRGVSGGIDMVVAVGLLMIPMVMLVASLPRWIETRSMAELAAQEAARTVVLANAQPAGEAAGTATARQIADNNGVAGSSLTVTYLGVLDWGEEITATVTVPMPVLDLPLIGTITVGDFSTSHTERVDDYRSFTP